jgi:hypothetical protein
MSSWARSSTSATEVKNLAVGDRVVVPFTISCGHCFFCDISLFSLCDNSNPTAGMAELVNGHSTSALFGYSHLYGGYAGGQAEYARVPFADVGPIKVPDGIPDDQVLFLSDIFPTGYMAAGELQHPPRRHRGRLGMRAGRAVRHPERLPARRRPRHRHRPLSRSAPDGARREGRGASTTRDDVFETLREMTGGRGPTRASTPWAWSRTATRSTPCTTGARAAVG